MLQNFEKRTETEERAGHLSDEDYEKLLGDSKDILEDIERQHAGETVEQITERLKKIHESLVAKR